jgi:hypothetical protein
LENQANQRRSANKGPLFKADEVNPEKRRQWFRDPLSHPDLEVMSVTQLADLQFDPRRTSQE